jgi:CubicO group peptidase (beta-lactamase class C family)
MENDLGRRVLWGGGAGLAVVVAVAVVVWLLRPDDYAVRAGTSTVSQTLCDDVFVSRIDPNRAFAEDVEPQPAKQDLLKRLHYSVDFQGRRVVTTWAGRYTSVATYRDGYGCTLGDAGAAGVAPAFPSAVSASDTPATIVPGDARLRAALDRAFAEPAKPPYRRVRAIVIMRDGKIVAERYAPGIGPDTALLAYSVSKSVVNALIGILAGDGKLDVHAPAPVQAWSSSGDPRHAITLDQLLRMTSGLDLDEGAGGTDPVSRMLCCERDMAAFAERAKLKNAPGRTWEYTSGNTLIASAIVRDATGGSAAGVMDFARRRLFEPLGMRHVAMEFDDAGTPVGSTGILASARDWARFGELYRDDGVAGGKRILPRGWVAYSTLPTLDSAYGAGFWVNAGKSDDARARIQAGMPADAYYASGNFGQRIVVVPSQKLVIVRFGATIDPPNFDIRGLLRLVSDVIATSRSAPPQPANHAMVAPQAASAAR